MLKKLGFYDLMKIMKCMKPRVAAYLTGLLGDSATEASIVILVPIIIKFMVDAAIKGDMVILQKGLILAVVEAVIVSVLFIGFTYLFWATVIKTITDIKIKMVRHVAELPVAYFEKNHSGDLISRLNNDVNVLYGPYGWILRQILFVSFSGIGSAILMVIMDWRFSIVLMLVAFASSYINAKLSVRIREHSDVIQKAMAELTERMSDMLTGFTVMKMFHIEDILRNKFHEKNSDIQALTIKRAKAEALLSTSNFTISWINFGGVIAIGAILSALGSVELSVVIAEINLLGNVNFMIRNLGDLIGQLQGHLAGAARVLQLLEENPEREYLSNSIVRSNKKMLEFNDVSFGYEDKEVLKKIDLSLDKGQMAALVGGSGGGKSTIIKLLMGFYPPGEGSILINGKPIGEYTLEELRSMIAYVPQDAYMFDGSIMDNIRIGNQKASEDEVINAAKSAFAHEFIVEMPEGYNTLVGERGIRLSGGQRQRIAIARALLKDAPILLLDEATSALDSHSEQQVQEALNKLMEGRTALVIAHRLSTIEDSDIIYVIEDGRVTEKGKHNNLIDMGGTYSRLYNLQFKSA